MARVNVFLVPDNQDRAIAVVVFVKDWVLRSDSEQANWRKVFAATSPFVGLPLVFASQKSSGDLALFGDPSLVRQLSNVPAEVLILGAQQYDIPGV